MKKKPFLIDVPVRVNIWTRPECQRKQFEVLKQARPSIIFLQSDGGRNDAEWQAIKKNRAIFDHEIDWECEIHKLYEDTNQGLYAMSKKTSAYIWERVDRCIFLEDDYIPSVCFFRFCSELLEKYKDDQRIEMISGNNVFTEYELAKPYDYFFSQTGWSIWGIATWRDRVLQREYPLPYANDGYIQHCLRGSLSAFWYNKVKGYSNNRLVDGHEPGGEYYHSINSALFHRLTIIPTRNLINNIGNVGEHAHASKKDSCFFNLPTFEIDFPITHPRYVIDDVEFGKMYAKKLGHAQTQTGLILMRFKRGISIFLTGRIMKEIKRKLHNSKTEK